MIHSVDAVAGYVVILPDTALEKVLPLQNLTTLTEPQHGLERVDKQSVQRAGLKPSRLIDLNLLNLLTGHPDRTRGNTFASY